MNTRLSKKLSLTLLLISVLLFSSCEPAAAATFTESFDTTTYKDTTNTTADWNTTLGRLQLAEGGIGVGNRSFANITSDGTNVYLAYLEAGDCTRVAKFGSDGSLVESFGIGGLSPCLYLSHTAGMTFDIVARRAAGGDGTGFPGGATGIYILYIGAGDTYVQRLDAEVGLPWWAEVDYIPGSPDPSPLDVGNNVGGVITADDSSDPMAGYVYIAVPQGANYKLFKLSNWGRREIVAEKTILPGKSIGYSQENVDLVASGSYLYFTWKEGGSVFIQKYRTSDLTEVWAAPLEVVSRSNPLSITAADSGGSFYILIHNGDDLEVRKFDGNKNLLWGPTSFNRNGDWCAIQYGANQLYAVWRDHFEPNNYSIRMQKIDIGTGAKLFGSGGMEVKNLGRAWNESLYYPLGQFKPVVTVDSSGNAVAGYTVENALPYKFVEAAKVNMGGGIVFRSVPPPKPPIYQSTGRGQSTTVATTTGNILSATLTATQTLNGGSISYYLSANGGTNWEGPVTQGSAWTFTNQGKALRWRADLSTPDTSKTPWVDSLSIDYQEALPCLEAAVDESNRCSDDPTNPYKMCFTATDGGGNPSDGTIAVWNNPSAGGTLVWGSSNAENNPGDGDWLRSVGASPGATVNVSVVVEDAGVGVHLSAGTYYGTVTMSCSPSDSCQAAGTCQQKTIAVTLTINEAMGTISGCVYRDTNSVCPADGAPDVDRSNAVDISATGYSTQTTGTNGSGCYTFSSVPYNPSGTVYRVEVKKPAGEEDQWSYACAGGFSGQGFKDVTLATGTSSWTVDFSIVNIVPGWFQVIDGDIHSEGEIRDEVP